MAVAVLFGAALGTAMPSPRPRVPKYAMTRATARNVATIITTS